MKPDPNPIVSGPGGRFFPVFVGIIAVISFALAWAGLTKRPPQAKPVQTKNDALSAPNASAPGPIAAKPTARDIAITVTDLYWDKDKPDVIWVGYKITNNSQSSVSYVNGEITFRGVKDTVIDRAEDLYFCATPDVDKSPLLPGTTVDKTSRPEPYVIGHKLFSSDKQVHVEIHATRVLEYLPASARHE